MYFACQSVQVDYIGGFKILARGEVVSLSMGFDLGGAVTLPRKMHFPSKLCILVNFHGALLVSSSGIGA